MAWLFGTTLFLSAALLFAVEPMVARMLLPLLGGAPAVWNTCLVFFQAALLGGYAYAHWLDRQARLGRQIAAHVALLGLAAVCLPVAIPARALESLPRESNPTGWLLLALAAMVGAPFFALSATGPLLQRWFSRTRHGGAQDPYFLYAASNAGSLCALLAYPTLCEPACRLAQQAQGWALGYTLLALAVLACGLAAWRCRRNRPAGGGEDPQPPLLGGGGAGRRALWGERLKWAVLAFVPSSLMLGVTTFLSTDIAAIPLLWVVPLSLYLVAFILAFSRRRWVPDGVADRAVPIAALALAFTLASKATEPAGLLMVLHLVFFFAAALYCHRALARTRPAPARLTEFYLAISAGGVLGGMFNALLAPLLFHTVAEYPLMIGAACLLRQVAGGEERGRVGWREAWVPAALGGLTVALALVLPPPPAMPLPLRNGLALGVPVVFAYVWSRRPVAFGLALLAILAGSRCNPDPHGRTLRVERNFFGVSRVTLDPAGTFRRIVHGNTIHGRQFIDPSRQCEPLAYYHRLGPAGDLFAQGRPPAGFSSVGVVGLGAGALVCYGLPGEQWTIYEIDPAVVRLARDTNYFTYLGRCAAMPVRVVLGDARLRLREDAGARHGLLVLDAFSSDAIPVHLLTLEALDLYLGRLAPGGLLAFHISNRCLNLEPVLGDLAGARGLTCLASTDDAPPRSAADAGKEPSQWLVMAHDPRAVQALARNPAWRPVHPRPRARTWTDDYSNLLSAFRRD